MHNLFIIRLYSALAEYPACQVLLQVRRAGVDLNACYVTLLSQIDCFSLSVAYNSATFSN